ncbi:MAG: hypothetical protein IJJ47_11675 [Methanosphaera sp.]|nr:hypothetical protein [Methanosphaera sp.]
MKSKYEKQSIDRILFLKEKQIISMKSNNINTLGELSNQSREDLKNIGISNDDISMINDELQLLGLGLKA